MIAKRARLHLRLLILELALVLFGSTLIGWYAGVQAAATTEQRALSRELDRLTATRAGSRAVPAPAAQSRVAPAARSLVGRIEIPRLRLSAVAREGVDLRTLRVAVGHIPGTALPGDNGNAAFAAHRDSFFRPLKTVRTGDEILLTTPAGVYRYTVTGTRIVQPDQVSVLNPTGGATLTLVTCYPFDFVGSAPQRFIVHASLSGPRPQFTGPSVARVEAEGHGRKGGS